MSRCVLRDQSLADLEWTNRVYENLKKLEQDYPDAFVDLALRCHENRCSPPSQIYIQIKPETILRQWGFLEGTEVPFHIRQIVLNALTGLKTNEVVPSALGLQDPRQPRSCCVIL